MSAPTDTNDDAMMLVQFLHDRDVACPVCKYNLRMLTSPRCPECGRELRLTVGTLEPFMRAWITLSIAAWVGAGIGLLFLYPLLIQGLRDAPVGIYFPIFYFIACIPLAILVTVMRKRILKLGQSTQWRLAVLAMTLMFAALLCMWSSMH